MLIHTNLVGRKCWKRSGNSREYKVAAVFMTQSFYVNVVLEDAQTGELETTPIEKIRMERA